MNNGNARKFFFKKDCQEVSKGMKLVFDGYLLHFMCVEEFNYEITGKYLFFSSDRDKLIEIVINEIEKHGFQRAKVKMRLLKILSPSRGLFLL